MTVVNNDIIEQLKNLQINTDVSSDILEEAKKAKELLRITARLRHNRKCKEWFEKHKEYPMQYYYEKLKGNENLKANSRNSYYRTKYGCTEEEYKTRKEQIKREKEEELKKSKEEIKNKFKTVLKPRC